MATTLAAIDPSSSLLLVSFLIGIVAAFLAYGSARRYEARTGAAAWHLPAGVWAFIFFLSWLIGLVLFLIAKATTRPRPTQGPEPGPGPGPGGDYPPSEPTPVAGWYPDPSRRHELRYWDGKGWTSHVRDGGSQGTDPT